MSRPSPLRWFVPVLESVPVVLAVPVVQESTELDSEWLATEIEVRQQHSEEKMPVWIARFAPIVSVVSNPNYATGSETSDWQGSKKAGPSSATAVGPSAVVVLEQFLEQVDLLDEPEEQQLGRPGHSRAAVAVLPRTGEKSNGIYKKHKPPVAFEDPAE